VRVLGIAGSPRRGGNTDLLLAEVLKGVAAEGAEVKTIFLNKLDITPASTVTPALRPASAASRTICRWSIRSWRRRIESCWPHRCSLWE